MTTPSPMSQCIRCIQSKRAKPRKAAPGSARCSLCSEYLRKSYLKRRERRAAVRRSRTRSVADKISGRGYSGRITPFAGIDRRALAGGRR